MRDVIRKGLVMPTSQNILGGVLNEPSLRNQIFRRGYNQGFRVGRTTFKILLEQALNDPDLYEMIDNKVEDYIEGLTWSEYDDIRRAAAIHCGYFDTADMIYPKEEEVDVDE